MLKKFTSGKRNRFIGDGFNLDLTYITPRLIAMGYPSSGFNALFRNDYRDVFRLLLRNHQSHFLVINVTLNYYDPSLFEGRSIQCGFSDHHSPPFDLLLSLVLQMDLWMRASQDNVCAVHCLAGKGRTGVLIVCYQIYHEYVYRHSEETPDFLSRRLVQSFHSIRGEGVDYVNQLRSILYFSQFIYYTIHSGIPCVAERTSFFFTSPEVLFQTIETTNCAKEYSFLIFDANSVEHKDLMHNTSWMPHGVRDGSYIHSLFFSLAGDFIIEVYFRQRCLAWGAFNTRFLPHSGDNDQLNTITLSALDFDTKSHVKTLDDQMIIHLTYDFCTAPYPDLNPKVSSVFDLYLSSSSSLLCSTPAATATVTPLPPPHPMAIAPPPALSASFPQPPPAQLLNTVTILADSTPSTTASLISSTNDFGSPNIQPSEVLLTGARANSLHPENQSNGTYSGHYHSSSILSSSPSSSGDFELSSSLPRGSIWRAPSAPHLLQLEGGTTVMLKGILTGVSPSWYKHRFMAVLVGNPQSLQLCLYCHEWDSTPQHIFSLNEFKLPLPYKVLNSLLPSDPDTLAQSRLSFILLPLEEKGTSFIFSALSVPRLLEWLNSIATARSPRLLGNEIGLSAVIKVRPECRRSVAKTLLEFFRPDVIGLHITSPRSDDTKDFETFVRSLSNSYCMSPEEMDQCIYFLSPEECDNISSISSETDSIEERNEDRQWKEYLQKHQLLTPVNTLLQLGPRDAVLDFLKLYTSLYHQSFKQVFDRKNSLLRR